MRAYTFHDDKDRIEVELLGPPNPNGLCKVRFPDGAIRVRHRDRITPIDDEARDLIQGSRRNKQKEENGQ